MTERVLTPQQELFLASYYNPKSPTFGNAKQSALKANYSEEYSDNIMALMPEWLSDFIGDSTLIDKALKNLDKLLDEENKNIQADMTKFVLKTLKKDKFSERTEVTGKDGESLVMNVVSYKDEEHNNTAQLPAETIPTSTTESTG